MVVVASPPDRRDAMQPARLRLWGPVSPSRAAVAGLRVAPARPSPPDGPVGRGLGLALVVQAVREYDGRIEVGTSDLGGAEFDVRMGAGT